MIEVCMKELNEITPPKRLYRSRTERLIGGVCGGLAQYFNMDPTIVRLLFLLLLFAGGAAFLIYIIMWIIVPLEP
jgi:phage shock protein C